MHTSAWCRCMLTDLLHAGPAAQQQRGVKALEQLAAEFEAGSNTALRTVWKWACYQARLCTQPSHPSHSCVPAPNRLTTNGERIDTQSACFDERVAVQQLKLMILRHSSITLAGQLVIMQSPSPSKDICFSLMFHDARLHSSRFCICFTKNIDKIFTSCT